MSKLSFVKVNSVSIAALAVTVSLGVASCDTAKKAAPKTSAPSTSNAPTKPANVLSEAKAAVELAYKGSYGTPPKSGPKAVRGKKLWVISCSDLLESCSVPGHHAVEAAKELGWDVTYAEGQLQASVTAERIRSAVAAGANAIILVASDCPQVQGPLQEAHDAGVVLVGIYSFDCNDPSIENGKSLFDAQALATFPGNAAEQQREWGKIKADWIIANSNGKATLIQLNANERLVIRHTNEGFDTEFARCAGCKELGRVEATDSDILQLTPALQKGATAISQHPETEFIHAPIDAIVPLLVLPAIRSSGADISAQLVGGEGLTANMDLIRSGDQAVALAYPHEWMAWSAVDITNRIFAKADPTVNQGISWQLVDKDHNLPASGPYVPPVDFKAAYREVWGVTANSK
ncbi:MAG: substrate-binding domain-containing protein [Acidimicrobiia bacterium]